MVLIQKIPDKETTTKFNITLLASDVRRLQAARQEYQEAYREEVSEKSFLEQLVRQALQGWEHQQRKPKRSPRSRSAAPPSERSGDGDGRAGDTGEGWRQTEEGR